MSMRMDRVGTQRVGWHKARSSCFLDSEYEAPTDPSPIPSFILYKPQPETQYSVTTRRGLRKEAHQLTPELAKKEDRFPEDDDDGGRLCQREAQSLKMSTTHPKYLKLKVKLRLKVKLKLKMKPPKLHTQRVSCVSTPPFLTKLEPCPAKAPGPAKQIHRPRYAPRRPKTWAVVKYAIHGKPQGASGALRGDQGEGGSKARGETKEELEELVLRFTVQAPSFTRGSLLC
ncbi:hypothetical protein CVT25_013332 [Psilocybe cyanescens]|uniref:Uncharacterized protein n=1 Tax=Psilocybe cyanescens TaxID=93625 RepID=A0A409WSQ1_PSICY|nr:hypothetical protein CVT25_013332 [Psilocybe cyanescens]